MRLKASYKIIAYIFKIANKRRCDEILTKPTFDIYLESFKYSLISDVCCNLFKEFETARNI